MDGDLARLVADVPLVVEEPQELVRVVLDLLLDVADLLVLLQVLGEALKHPLQALAVDTLVHHKLLQRLVLLLKQLDDVGQLRLVLVGARGARLYERVARVRREQLLFVLVLFVFDELGALNLLAEASVPFLVDLLVVVALSVLVDEVLFVVLPHLRVLVLEGCQGVVGLLARLRPSDEPEPLLPRLPMIPDGDVNALAAQGLALRIRPFIGVVPAVGFARRRARLLDAGLPLGIVLREGRGVRPLRIARREGRTPRREGICTEALLRRVPPHAGVFLQHGLLARPA